ncbi:MAG: integrase core domain-containing protein [bacterium]
MGLVPCHTPVRSPQSNGIADALFSRCKRDYVYQNCLETADEVRRQVPEWIEDYNRRAPHRALGMKSPNEFYEEWVRSHIKFKITKKPVQI